MNEMAVKKGSGKCQAFFRTFLCGRNQYFSRLEIYVWSVNLRGCEKMIDFSLDS
jgi:hypothetical protein